MESFRDPSSGADNPAGSQAQQPPHSIHNRAGLLSANHTNPVQVMPCQIQMFAKFDDQGRRRMVLENLPLDRNYVANWINSGAEFAIGGTPEFIFDALAKELAARVFQDSRNQCTQSWHVVVFPESNMSNAPMSHLYRGSEATDRYPLATTVRSSHQNYQNNQQTMGLQPNPQNNQNAMFTQQYQQSGQQATFVQQNPYNRQQAFIPQKSFLGNQQPMLAQNSAMGGYGRGDSSVSRSQQSQFTTPMSGSFRNGGGSTMMFPQEQVYSQIPQQDSFQGFGPNNGPAQATYQGQGNNMMFNQSSGPPVDYLPQVHRPIFDKYGYIVGEEGNRNDGNMYGGNLYNNNVYSSSMDNRNTFGPAPSIAFQGAQQQFNPSQHVQNTEMRDPQLTAAAQSFYSFVENKMNHEDDNQDEGGQADDDQNDCEFEEEEAEEEEEGEDQDEGIALGNTGSRNADSSGGQQAAAGQPESESLPTEVLLASEREPHRFADNTGMGLCDYCGRDGHEADVCIKWDPVHFDKPVCTACNNDQHSLDECPKFRAMPTPEKQALLLGKGGRRPGVRSEYHAWTSYVHRDGYMDRGRGGGLPLTRRFLFNLSVNNHDSGVMLQNVWKVWDYARGVPDQFLDPRAESLAGDPVATVDERFMGGKHELGWKIHPAVRVED